MGWMTAMRDRIHLEARKEMKENARRRGRLNRLDNTTRAMHAGFATVWTQKQRNARRRTRKMRLVFREVKPRVFRPFLVH